MVVDVHLSPGVAYFDVAQATLEFLQILAGPSRTPAPAFPSDWMARANFQLEINTAA
jgi:hypothetical protein